MWPRMTSTAQTLTIVLQRLVAPVPKRRYKARPVEETVSAAKDAQNEKTTKQEEGETSKNSR